MDDLNHDSNLPRDIPTESELVKRYAVSRSTILNVIEIMYKKSIAIKEGSDEILLRLPNKGDHFSREEVK